MEHVRRWALGLALVAALVGCGTGGTAVERDEDLEAGLRDLSARAGAGQLADLTDFAWDAVFVFPEGVSAEAVEAEVGSAVLPGDRYYDAGNLLVFVREDEVVRVVSVLPDLLVTGGRARWDADVGLEPRGEATPASLRLVDA